MAAKDFKDWPTAGYVRTGHMVAALDITPRTLKSWMAEGLISRPVRYGPNVSGWPVDQARQELSELPEKVANLLAAKGQPIRRTWPAAQAPRGAISTNGID